MAEKDDHDLIKEISDKFTILRKEQEKGKFFRSCISEGLVCKGVRNKINVAYDVNDKDFVMEIKKLQDWNSSRVLDSFYKHSGDRRT